MNRFDNHDYLDELDETDDNSTEKYDIAPRGYEQMQSENLHHAAQLYPVTTMTAAEY